MSAKTIKILYWVFNILFGGFMIFSGIQNALVTQGSVDLLNGILHFPVYFIAFIGVAKILGGVAILVPGFPRIKEWAYAGLTFDIIGAIYAVGAVSPDLSGVVPMLPFLLIAALAYITYCKKQSLDGKTI